MSEVYLNCHVEEKRSFDVNISAELFSCHPSFSQENVKGSSDYIINKSGKSLDLAFQLGAMTRRGYSRDCHVASLLTMTAILFSFNAQATCTPTPDCASIGYTQTSCETDYLACPFDISKMKCMPCDSSYRYTCSGDNIVGGTGSACGGKYVSCECEGGLDFKNGVCPQSCTVGMIYYSDKSCSSNYDSTKTPIGVVVKDNELVMSKIRSTGMKWSSSNTNVSGITETTDSAVAKQDFNGKANTLAIIATFTSDTVDNNAAIYCNNYATKGTYTEDWYLPASGELSRLFSNMDYNNFNTTMTTLGWTFEMGYFWSSSERSGNHAWIVHSSNGSRDYRGKPLDFAVTCFLSIN